MNQIYSLKKLLPIGAAVKPIFLSDKDPHSRLLKNQFTSIVAENIMKPMFIEPEPSKFNFSLTDKMIEFAHNNNMDIRWHTLCWHNQTPSWMFMGKEGKIATKEEAKSNLKNFIQTVVSHNKDKGIESYDVVNECISDSTFNLRNGRERSLWYQIIGPEYIDLAFTWAHEADPNATLIINDYNLESVIQKRAAMINLIKDMKNRNVPIDGVGIQMHISLGNPSLQIIKETIEEFAALNIKVYITEMDMSLFEWEDKSLTVPKEKLPVLLELQAIRYKELFTLFKEEMDSGKLQKVVLWGVDDSTSWKNNFPVKGRTDYALCFDRDLHLKI